MRDFKRPTEPYYRNLHPYGVVVLFNDCPLNRASIYRSHPTPEKAQQAASDLNRIQETFRLWPEGRNMKYEAVAFV